jgi:lysophospholipase L1-like esterase
MMLNIGFLFPARLAPILLALTISASASDNPTSQDTAPYTIVTFGDSTTALRAGVDVYSSQLERRLKSSPRPVRIVNKGVPGNTTVMAMKRFPNDVLAEKPDLVIIQFGINDSTVDVWKTPPANGPRVSLEDYAKNLQFFVEEIRKNGGDVLLMTPNPLRWTPALPARYAKPPYDPSNEKGFSLVLEKYVEAIRALSEKLDVQVADVYALYNTWAETNNASCAVLLGDGMHPNTRGQTLTTDALEPIIKSRIAAAK